MSAVIVPTVTAYDLHEYRKQMERIAFAPRIHVDLMDGLFAPTKSPDIDQLWLPKGVTSDVHVMFRHPDAQIKKILAHNPALIIVQAEADKESVKKSIAGLKKTKVRVGLSLLPNTRVTDPFVTECIGLVSYVLIFSGHLGFHGGVADLHLLTKVAQIRSINPRCELAWDGGVNEDNVRDLASGGIEVLNVGGAIQKSDDPERAYHKLSTAVA